MGAAQRVAHAAMVGLALHSGVIAAVDTLALQAIVAVAVAACRCSLNAAVVDVSWTFSHKAALPYSFPQQRRLWKEIGAEFRIIQTPAPLIKGRASTMMASGNASRSVLPRTMLR